MTYRQGDIVLANLSPVKGHEQAGTRPVLILQNDVLNQNLSTVVVAPITSKNNMHDTMITYALHPTRHGLTHDSVVLLFQLRTIDPVRCIHKIGSLTQQEFYEVRKRIAYVF